MGYHKHDEFCTVCGETSCQEGCATTDHDARRRDREFALAEVIDELIARDNPPRVASSEVTENGRVEVITKELPPRRFFVTVTEHGD